MDKKSKLLLLGVGVLLVVSVAATFYKTVILQDFDVTGVWIEFPTEETSYAWFFYDNEEYELELETTDEGEILAAIAEEVGVAEAELYSDFVDTYIYAFSQAGPSSE